MISKTGVTVASEQRFQGCNELSGLNDLSKRRDFSSKRNLSLLAPILLYRDGIRRSQIYSKEGNVDFITKTVVHAREWCKGQTMTEYALILSAVAVIVYAGYQTMGNTITSLLSSVDTSL